MGISEAPTSLDYTSDLGWRTCFLGLDPGIECYPPRDEHGPANTRWLAQPVHGDDVQPMAHSGRLGCTPSTSRRKEIINDPKHGYAGGNDLPHFTLGCIESINHKRGDRKACLPSC